MPYSMNGIGTSVCRSRGTVQWAERPEGWWARANFGSQFQAFDALECFVIAFLPIFPYKAVHTHNWQGDTYSQIRIRWSWDLVLRTYALHWFWAPILALSLWVGAASWGNPWAGLALGVGLFAASVWFLRRWGRRDRDIRWALGPHVAGASDPASWTPELLAPWPSVQEQFKAERCSSASRQALLERRYCDAMWAARLCVAREDRAEGERLTDEVLADPGFQAAVESVREAPEDWESHLGLGRKKA